MSHICSPACECKLKLDAALAALEKSSQLLSASVFSGADEQVEKCFTCFRSAKTTLFEALDLYNSHFADPTTPA
jgi:hypothetical protein